MTPQNIEQFQEYLSGQFHDLGIEVRQLLDGLNPDQFKRRPQPGKWSIAQHIHHLNVTGTLYLEQVKEKIPHHQDGGKNKSVRGEPLDRYKPRLPVRKFIEALEPPVKRTFKAPRVFQPARELEKDAVLLTFCSMQDEFVRCLEGVIHYHLLKEKITSPATGMLKLQLGETFLVNIAHEKRHLWHAEEIAEADVLT